MNRFFSCPSTAKIFADGQTVKAKSGAGGDLDGKPASLILAAISGTIKLCPIWYIWRCYAPEGPSRLAPRPPPERSAVMTYLLFVHVSG